jgi:hypothetical protein
VAASELNITKDTVVSVDDDAQLVQAGEALYALIGFTPDDCTVALMVCGGHVGKAAEFLTTGAWMSCKSVSWNWTALEATCEKLVDKTGLPENDCLTMLKNCCGNEALAERKLKGLPALP